MKKLLMTSVAALALATTATAQEEKHFDGGYVGAEAGYLDSGDGFNGLYYGTTLGFRRQNDSNYVFGVEGNLGKTNIDIGSFDNIVDSQWSIHGTAGWVFGAEKRDLFSVGVGYAKVNVSAGGSSTSGDGVSSFVGYERALGKNIALRFRVTSYDTFETFIGTGGVSLRF